jgi:hypothetical protein
MRIAQSSSHSPRAAAYARIRTVGAQLHAQRKVPGTVDHISPWEEMLQVGTVRRADAVQRRSAKHFVRVELDSMPTQQFDEIRSIVLMLVVLSFASSRLGVRLPVI